MSCRCWIDTHLRFSGGIFAESRPWYKGSACSYHLLCRLQSTLGHLQMPRGGYQLADISLSLLFDWVSKRGIRAVWSFLYFPMSPRRISFRYSRVQDDVKPLFPADRSPQSCLLSLEMSGQCNRWIVLSTCIVAFLSSVDWWAALSALCHCWSGGYISEICHDLTRFAYLNRPGLSPCRKVWIWWFLGKCRLIISSHLCL